MPSALAREDFKTEMFEERVPWRAWRCESSVDRVAIVWLRAACCEERGWRADEFCEICWCRDVVRRWDRWAKRASFSGLIGIGGAGMFDGWDAAEEVGAGNGRSNGESRRFG